MEDFQTDLLKTSCDYRRILEYGINKSLYDFYH